MRNTEQPAVPVPPPVSGSRPVAFSTAGIARNMQWDIGPRGELVDVPMPLGGGDLNGSSAQYLKGQAGTNARQVPRLLNRGNYCGTV